MDTDTAELGRELAALRASKGLSLRELGERAGVSPSAISELERGERDVYASTLVRLGAQLGVRPGWVRS